VPKKILIVEDEAIIAMSEAQMLEKHGFEVSTVHNGDKAVEAAASDPKISLILMDIDLGKGMDGTEAAEIILETRDLPVVFLSSHTEPAIVKKTEGITSYGYIVKNSGETVLIASIRMAFRLWESEDKFRKAFEYTSVGMVLTSPSGELLQINAAFASMLGYSPAEIYSVNFTKLTHPEDIEMSVDQMKMILYGKADHRQFTKRYIRKDGAVVWADINTMLLRDSEGKPIHFVTHAQDITESKRMQEEIDRQREQYDLLLRSAPAPILVAQDGKYVYSNPSAAKLMGYTSSQELIGTPIQQTICKDSLKKIKKRMEQLEAGRSNPAQEITILRKDGETLCCESTSIPITYNSSPAALIIGRNLTAQKQIEAALKESRDKIASILKAAPTGIGVVQGRKKRTLVEANEKLCVMTGYTREELLGKSARILYPSQEDYEYVGSEKYRQIDEHGTGSVETRWQKKDGTIMEVLLASSPIHPTDISLGVTFTAMDITQRKQAKKKLHEKEALYRNLMENSIDATYLMNETGKVLQVNHTACEMLGYSEDELLQLTIDDIDPNFPSKRFIEFWKHKPEGSTVLFETIHRHKSGKEIPVEVNGIFFILDGKKYLFGVSRDLTERKRKEEALKNSEEKYRLLFNYSNDAIFVHEIGEDNLPGKNIEVNEQATTLLQYSREELLSMSAKSVMPEARASEMLLHAQELLQKKHLTFETENIRKDGVVVSIEVSAYLYSLGTRRFVVASVRDITTRIHTEENLRKALKEKDFLLRELNHRVKNNLSMVSSLISLKDSEIEADLSDLKHRINAIRLVHEKLQHYKELDKIEVREYFQELLETIFSSSADRNVRIINKVEELSIPTKTAISLGLIANEIATNAIKYGFNSKKEAIFTVSLAEDKENHLYSLSFSNSGNPFPEDINIENTETSGLQLISILAKQVKGTLELEKRPSPKFTIRFPVDP